MDERKRPAIESENAGRRGGLMVEAADPLPIEIVVLTERIRQTWSEEERLLRARQMVVTLDRNGKGRVRR